MTTIPIRGLTEAERWAMGGLEQELDQRRHRLLAGFYVRWQSRSRRPRRRPDLKRSLAVESAPTQAWVDALRESLSHGAYQSAERLVVRRLERLGAAGVPRDAVPLALETLLAIGDRPRALEVARIWRSHLATIDRGATALQLLGVGVPGAFLPTGYPNMLHLSRETESAARSHLNLALLEAPRHLWARTPELHLLLFNRLYCSDRLAALRFLNRFLSLHRLPPCSWRSELRPDEGPLAQLRFEPRPAPARTSSLVSVLVAARNAGGTIARALDSLLEQSYRNLEILVGDDASDDDTLEVLRRRYASEPRVRLFRGRRQQGAYNMRNALASYARGALLTFHDADDLALPTRIERQAERATRKGKELSLCSFVRVAQDGGFVFFKDQKATRLCLVSMMLKRTTFEEVGRFRPARVGADLELVARVRARFGHAAIDRLKSPLIFASWPRTSLTRAGGTEALEDGYRAPIRRLYSELVYWQEGGDVGPEWEEEMDRRLRSSGNFIEPAALESLG